MTTILLFGNPALPNDNLALRVGAELTKHGFTTRHVHDPLELSDIDFSDAVILDVALGVPDVKLITDVDKLVLGRLVSLHDFDMAYFLKLLKQLGKVQDVRIIGIPPTLSLEVATSKAEELLRTL